MGQTNYLNKTRQQTSSTATHLNRFSREGTRVPAIARQSFPVAVRSVHRYHTMPFTQIFPFPCRVFEPQPETVIHMIQQLPLSLKSLVEHIEVLASEEDTIRCLEQQQQIYLASGGGAIPG
jgi:hypothetical protein